MAGVDNLIPTNRRSKDEVREIGRKGGKASGKSRREKKSMKEWAQILGEVKMKKMRDDGMMEEVTFDQATVATLYEVSHDKTNPTAAVRAAEALAKLKDEYSITVNMAEAEDNRPEIEIE